MIYLKNRDAACTGWGAALGMLLGSSLSLDARVSVVARSAFAQLKLVCQLHLFLKRSDLAHVTALIFNDISCLFILIILFFKYWLLMK